MRFGDYHTEASQLLVVHHFIGSVVEAGVLVLLSFLLQTFYKCFCLYSMSVLLTSISKVQAIPNQMPAKLFQDLDNLIVNLILKDNSP